MRPLRVDDANKLSDTIAANLQIPVEEKQELLEIFDPLDRLNRVADILEVEIEKLNVDRTINTRVKRQMERAQKEYYLNEKLKAIHKELGRGENNELDELKKKIETSGMPKEVQEKAAAGIEAAGNDAADVGGVHRYAQLSRLAARGTVEKEIARRFAISKRAEKILSKKIITGSKKSRNASSNSWRCGNW